MKCIISCSQWQISKCSGIQLYVLLSSYLCFIPFLNLILYVLGDDTSTRLKKNIELFFRPYFLKTDAAGRVFIFPFYSGTKQKGDFF